VLNNIVFLVSDLFSRFVRYITFALKNLKLIFSSFMLLSIGYRKVSSRRCFSYSGIGGTTKLRIFVIKPPNLTQIGLHTGWSVAEFGDKNWRLFIGHKLAPIAITIVAVLELI